MAKYGLVRPSVRMDSRIDKRIGFRIEEDGKAPMAGISWLPDLEPNKVIKVSQSKVLSFCHTKQAKPWRIQVVLDGKLTGLYLKPIHLFRYARIQFEYKLLHDDVGDKLLSAGGLREVSSGRITQLWGTRRLRQENLETKFALEDIGEVLLENQETREDKAPRRTPSHAEGRGSSSDKISNGDTEQILANDYISLAYHKPSSIGGKRVATISASDVEEEIRRWKHAVVGYLVGEDAQDLNVESYLGKQWREFGSFRTYLLKRPGFFLFRFENGADKYRLLEQGQWFINNRPFILKMWKPDLSLDPSCFLSTVPVWVRFPELPLHLWSLESLAKIASLIGKPLFVDEPTARKVSLEYARVCIEIELGDKLPEIVHICADDDDDNILAHKVVYEWRPCDHCWSLLHDASECARNIHSSSASEDVDISDLLQSGDASVEHRWETDFCSHLQDEVPGLETADDYGHDGNNTAVDINCSAEEYCCAQECLQLQNEAAIGVGTIQVLLESEDYSQTACLLEKNAAINWLAYYDMFKSLELWINRHLLG